MRTATTLLCALLLATGCTPSPIPDGFPKIGGDTVLGVDVRLDSRTLAYRDATRSRGIEYSSARSCYQIQFETCTDVFGTTCISFELLVPSLEPGTYPQSVYPAGGPFEHRLPYLLVLDQPSQLAYSPVDGVVTVEGNDGAYVWGRFTSTQAVYDPSTAAGDEQYAQLGGTFAALY
jgi:hypothetical protein